MRSSLGFGAKSGLVLCCILSGCQPPGSSPKPSAALPDRLCRIGSAGSALPDDHREDEAKLATLFPGARLKKIALPLDAPTTQRLSAAKGIRFTGAEAEWEAFEATRSGKRVGLALLAHADLAKNLEIHLGIAVDPQIRVLQTIGMERTNAGFQQMVRQFVRKGAGAPFQLGQDLKPVADYPPQFSQALADTTRRGLVLLDEFAHRSRAPSKGAMPRNFGRRARDQTRQNARQALISAPIWVNWW